jgi:cardiolipin synthase A/B
MGRVADSATGCRGVSRPRLAGELQPHRKRYAATQLFRDHPLHCRLLLLLTCLVAGCAELPVVDDDIARAIQTADTGRAVDLMREQTERIARRPFIGGNAVELLRNGPQTYAAMTAAISAAKQRIDLESYTFDTGEGGQFAELLLTKRAQGLDVNLIYDAWGSLGASPAMFDRLRKGGVHVLEVHPLGPVHALDFNRRDHRKLLVTDAAIVIMGGVNISEVYENRRDATGRAVDPNALPWRDTDVRIEGPVAVQFEETFMSTWRRQKGGDIPDAPPTPATRHGDARVLALAADPNTQRPLIYRTLLVAITLARSSIHLTTGFFAPPPDLLHALERAARRGVDVRIIVPTHSTSALAISAGRSDYEDLMEAGVHIFERQDVVLHAKTAVIDGGWSAVGSSNLDWRSVVFNNEVDALILDAAFAKKMEAMFADDVAASREIDARQWARRPFSERLDEWWAKLVQMFL